METTYLYKYNPKQEIGIIKKKTMRGGKLETVEYLERWISLDTETSHNHDEESPRGWVYQWAFKFGEDRVGGQTPAELMQALNAIHTRYELGENRKCIIFIHNLSYDIVYLKEWLKLWFGDWTYLAIRPHKFIEVRVGGFILRCTYKLSNKSLRSWAKDLGCTHQKLTEDKAYYDTIHYQDEHLNAENWAYQFGDVDTLDECVEKQLGAYGDTVVTVPLTSTGYVRRVARKNYKKDRRNRKRFLLTRLNPLSYALCRTAYRGAVTHGDRHYAGKTVIPEADKGEFIRHRDFRSHYPSQQRTRTFPVGKFALWKKHATLDDVREVMGKYCCLMWVTFENVTLKDKDTPIPYLSFDKVFKGRLTPLDYVLDNGAVLKCDGVFKLALTELDLKWIVKQYKIKSYDIEELWTSKRGYLPAFMKETVDQFFKGKTELKDLEREARERGDIKAERYLHMELLKSKNGLNGIYGMSATDPIRELCEMLDNGEWKCQRPDVAEALDKYYSSENSFNRYQWGVWTTATARDELLTYAEIIQRAGGRPLYCDTDSIFYLSNDAVEAAIEKENKRRYDRAVAMGAYIEHRGKIVNYDSFDDEGEDIIEFRFLHAKCYAYRWREKNEEKFKCVIAGVSEFEDARQEFSREDELLGDIDNLHDGWKFEKCGGTKARYTQEEIGEYEHDGHKVALASACIITPTTKTLSNQIKLQERWITWEKIS